MRRLSQIARYYVADYLFWANSGTQPPRSGLSTISVE